MANLYEDRVYTNNQLSWFIINKQDTLISWTNIKTINWVTILWSWDLTISLPTWWDMFKADNLGWLASISTARTNLWLWTLATQNWTFTSKQDSLVSWTNIKTINWIDILSSWNLITWWTITRIFESNTAQYTDNAIYQNTTYFTNKLIYTFYSWVVWTVRIKLSQRVYSPVFTTNDININWNTVVTNTTDSTTNWNAFSNDISVILWDRIDIWCYAPNQISELWYLTLNYTIDRTINLWTFNL